MSCLIWRSLMKKFHVKDNEIIEEPWEGSSKYVETNVVTVRGYLFTFNENMTKADFKVKWLEWANVRKDSFARKARKNPEVSKTRYYALLYEEIVHQIEAIEKLEV